MLYLVNEKINKIQAFEKFSKAFLLSLNTNNKIVL